MLDEYTDLKNCFDMHSIVYRTDMVRKMAYHQAEGIYYTDIEWRIEPMTQVRRFLFLKEPVTCYLVGRKGQSTELTTYYKKYHHIAEITAGLIERSVRLNESCVDSAKKYYNYQISELVRQVYYGWLRHWGGEKGGIDILKFEQRIIGNGVFYGQAEKIFASILIWHYYYVIDWRRHHSVYTVKRLIYNFCWLILHFIYHSVYVNLRRLATGS